MRIASRTGTRVAIAAVASGALAAGAFALVTSASASSASAAGAVTAGQHVSYGFQTIDNNSDLTFNQLLGVNNDGVIAGYFGSGAQGHPTMGYLLQQGQYRNENFPGSVQTQVTGLNDNGVTVGFWSGMNAATMMNDNFGFVDVGGHFRTADFPAGDPASPPVDQLLGVNDHDVAVGFYTDAKGNNHGYEYNISGNGYTRVLDPGDPGASLTAAAINNHGDVAGFYTDAKGNTDGFEATRARCSTC